MQEFLINYKLDKIHAIIISLVDTHIKPRSFQFATLQSKKGYSSPNTRKNYQTQTNHRAGYQPRQPALYPAHKFASLKIPKPTGCYEFG